jgi:hypothetical protein
VLEIVSSAKECKLEALQPSLKLVHVAHDPHLSMPTRLLAIPMGLGSLRISASGRPSRIQADSPPLPLWACK